MACATFAVELLGPSSPSVPSPESLRRGGLGARPPPVGGEATARGAAPPGRNGGNVKRKPPSRSA
eukprot:11167487-Lingulodinium_polyedra.AAC.1